MSCGSTFSTSSSRRSVGDADNSSSAARILLRIVDGSLAAVILVAPWFMGGRHPLGQFVLVLLSVIAAIAWGARQCVTGREAKWRHSTAEFVLLAALALVMLQLAPLPPAALQWLSPHQAEMLPLWNADSSSAMSLGLWNQVSLTPGETRAGLAMFLSYALLFLVAVQRLRDVEDIERVLCWLAISVTLLAIGGILQYLLSNGKFLWVYQHPYRGTSDAVKGPFINRNHFAHLLALGLAPLICLVQRVVYSRSASGTTSFGSDVAKSRRQLVVVAAGLALSLTLFAGLMTLSRGGAAMMFLSALLTVGMLYRASLLERRFVVGMVAVFAFIAISLTIHGFQQVSTRLDDYATGSLTDLDASGARRKIWEADLKAIPDYWVLGAGVGSHAMIYPMYFPEYWDTEYTHAENGYLQVALEAGLPGLALLLVGIGLCAMWSIGALRKPASKPAFVCAVAVAAGLLVSAVHSIADFVWYIPSCMAVTVLLAACGLRLYQLGHQEVAGKTRARVVPRAVLGTATACLVLVGVWMIDNRLGAAMAAPHWDAYLSEALTRPSDADPSQDTFEHLRNVVAWNPDDARPHIRLAQVCLRRFNRLQQNAENVMPLNQIRDAAIASRFPSRSALEQWLERAVGEHWQYLDLALDQTRAGLALCPLQGEGYAYLAELCFLEGMNPAASQACIEQGLKVRPYGSDILLVAGSTAFLAGKFDDAFGYWRRGLHSGPEGRALLTDLLVSQQLLPEVVVTAFEPDLPTLRLLYEKYTRINCPAEQLRPLLLAYVAAGEKAASELDEQQAAILWLELHPVYRRLHNTQKMFEVLQHAATIQPGNYEIRSALGLRLCEQQEFAEAEKHLNWCVQRRPSDKEVQAALAIAVKGRLSRAPHSAARSEGSPTMEPSRF